MATGLLGFKNATREDVLEYLELAEEFVDAQGRIVTPGAYRQALDGMSVALLFFEPSTRTRASFELAVNRLGGYPLVVMTESSSIQKGETELDTCQNLEAMGVSAVVIRHPERHVPLAVADRLGIPVLNAGNGMGEHPTQALIDAFTLRRAFGRRGGDLSGLRIAIIGDIVHSRVARSDVAVFRALGADVVVAGPPKLLPLQRDDEWDADIVASRQEALRGADAVIMLRIQKERIHHDVVNLDAYVREWGVDEMVVQDEMKDGAVVMHPGPVIRGVELASGVADSDRSLILKQAAHGVAIRQAVLVRQLST